MAHAFETAATGRSKCRGCGEKIAAGELRLAERIPNPFGEGEAALYFHPDCGALKRPEAFLEALAAREEPLPDGERLSAEARLGNEHPRLTRLDGAERSPTGRAQCRACKDTIAKDAWRLKLVFFEEGRFQPAGYLHPRCAPSYCETPTPILPRVKRFAPGLREEDVAEIERELGSDAPA
jgi:hypothetical protein